MATTTTNLGLQKPEGSDLVSIGVLNSNADKLDKLGITVISSGTNDLDGTPFMENGTFYFTVSAALTNAPSGATNGWLRVMTNGSQSAVKQLFFRTGTANTTDSQTWVRTKINSVWSNWREYFVLADTAKQSQTNLGIQSGYVNIAMTGSDTDYSGQQEVTYDPPFAAAPIVVCTPRTASSAVKLVATDANSASGVTIRAWRTNSTGVIVHWIAIGSY